MKVSTNGKYFDVYVGTPAKSQAEAQAFAFKPIFGVESNSVSPTLPGRKKMAITAL